VAAGGGEVVGFGLVLGAGGLAGEAFHRGVLRALHDVGLAPGTADVIVGTSAGSIVAASVRRTSPRGTGQPVVGRPRPGRMWDRAGALELVRRPRQALNALLLTREFAGGKTSNLFIGDVLRRRHGQAWPDAALWIVAVRRSDGRRVVFGKPGEPPADMAVAVAASCAIPAYFAAVDIDGTSYVDGGVHSPTNADLLASWDLDLVVISSPMSVDPRSAGPRVDLPVRLLFHRYLRQEVWALRRRGDTVVMIEPDAAVLDTMGLNMMSGRRLDEIEERGYEVARRRLRQVGYHSGPGRG
jgi:NTE family protein